MDFGGAVLCAQKLFETNIVEVQHSTCTEIIQIFDYTVLLTLDVQDPGHYL